MDPKRKFEKAGGLAELPEREASGNEGSLRDDEPETEALENRASRGCELMLDDLGEARQVVESVELLSRSKAWRQMLSVGGDT